MDCVIDKRNLGLSDCIDLPALISGMITTPASFKLSAVDALDPDKWQDALLDIPGVRIYLWPFFKGFENTSEAAVYEDTPLSDLFVRGGKYRFRAFMQEALCVHKAMFTHRGTNRRVFFLDSENQLIGTEDNDGNFVGFTVSLLNTEKLVLSDGSVSTKSPVYIVLQDYKELDANGKVIDGTFVRDLIRLTDVDLTVGAVITDLAFDVTVTAACDGTPVTGLVAADFSFHNAAGAVVAITSVTESNGVYTIHQSGGLFVDGNINLVAAGALTVPGYESTGAASVNVP